MSNFIICFSSETKNKLINNGYKLLNEQKSKNGTMYYLKNNKDNKLNFSKNEVIYTNKMLY